jgi:hypothetical protein
MTFHAFNEARANFEAQRKEQAAIAAQALEMRLLQRDFIKVTSDLKIALERLEADRAAAAAPPPAKPTTAAPAPKAAVPRKPADKKLSEPKRPASPQSLAIVGLEQRLAVIATKISALSKRLSKSQH